MRPRASVALLFLFYFLFAHTSILAQSSSRIGTAPSSCAGAALSGNLTLHAVSTSGGARLCDGYALPSASSALSNATPLSLASADFDGDGVPDVVAGFATGNSGVLSIYRGNVHALWPYGEALRIAPPPPFLPAPRTVTLPEAPDFLVAGDFDADGKLDIIVAQRGSHHLYFLKGEGRRGFAAARAIETNGAITALTAGEMGAPTGLPAIAIGISTTDGSRAVLFASPMGAVRAAPHAYLFGPTISALAFGRFDGNAAFDLAIAGGSELMLLHGGTTHKTLYRVSTQELGFPVKTIAPGDFVSNRSGIAALDDSGNVHLLQHALAPGSLAVRMAAIAENASFTPRGKESSPALKARGVTGSAKARNVAVLRSARANGAEWVEQKTIAVPPGFSQDAPQLLAARMTGGTQLDLLVPDSGTGKIHILSTKSGRNAETSSAMRFAASVAATSAPAAVLPMRLNQHGLSGLVVLLKGQSVPSVMPQDIDPNNIFTVTNTLDTATIGGTAPAGSLRDAINQANAADGPAEVVFNIPTSDPNYNSTTGVFLIRPLSEAAPGSLNNFALPPINNTITIDGYTQPGASPNTLAQGDNAKVVIQIDGSLATTPGGTGLSPFDDTGSTFRGMSFTGWTNDAVSNGTASGAEGIEANGAGDFIEGNLIGLDPTGKVSANRIGIFGDNGPAFSNVLGGNVIGGTTPQARNVLSGNQVGNILLLSTCTECVVEGNFIGTDLTGATVPANSSFGDGVGLNGPTAAIGTPQPNAGNVISGNAFNVDINDLTNGGAAENSSVQGNLLGTDATGKLTVLANTNAGVSIQHDVSHMQIGGSSTSSRNVISGSETGVSLLDNATFNLIQGNFIGTNANGSAAVANTLGINTGGTGAVGEAPASQNTIQGNVISGNTGDGIHISGTLYEDQIGFFGNTIQGNSIGTASNPASAVPNGGNGIYLDNQATANQIGGTVAGAGNVIENNGGNGIYVDTGGTDGGYGAHNVITGNVVQSNKGAGVFLNSGIDNPVRVDSIFGNGALGIDLAPKGHNANTPCGTAPSGPNNSINAPVLTGGSGSVYISATATDANGNTSEFSNAVLADGTANLITLVASYVGVANSSYTLDFYQSPSPDGSGYGEGETWIGSVNITTDGNCNGTVSTPVNLNGADVAVTISTQGSYLQVGADLGQYFYTAVVTNNGASTAHNVVFTDPLPAGESVSHAYCNLEACLSPVTTNAGTCSVSGTTVTCNIPALAPGATATIVIPVYLTQAGTEVNTVTVSATETDPVPANNTASSTDQVNNPFPFINSLSPSSALVNQAGGVLLNIYAESGALPTTQITFNGTPVPIVDIIDNQVCTDSGQSVYCADIQVQVPQSLLSAPGQVTVEMTNPDPGPGGGSNFPSDATFNIVSSCTYTTDLSFFEADASGTNLIPEQVTVQPSAPSCTWTASSAVPWLQVLDLHNNDANYQPINETGSGTITGPGAVDFAVAPNTSANARMGNITVAGQTQSITQDGGASCTYSLDKNSASFPVAGGSGQIAITSGCSGYFVQAYVPWITVPQSSGLLSNNATASYTVAPNTGPPRTGNILIGGVVFTVNQAAPACYYTVSPTSNQLPAGGGTGSFAVTANSASCTYSVKPSDSSVTLNSPATGTGNSTVKYTVAPNTGGPATPTITITDGTASAVYSISEASAFTCTFSLSPGSISVPANGYSNYVLINASYDFCKWTAASNNPAGLVLTQGTSGMGTGAVYYSVGQNTSGSSRVLTLTAGCETFTVTQAGQAVVVAAPVLSSISPSSVAAGSATFTLTATGTGFVSGAVINFNGSALATTYVSATQLTAQVPASAVTTGGTVSVSVTNPSGGGTSNALTFTITSTANNPVPTITTISPTGAQAGAAAFTLTVNGTNFVSSSVVKFNGAALTTTYVSATQLTAMVPATAVTNAGTYPVVVTNPTPGGGTSNSVNFTVTAANNPVPTITTLAPASVQAGSAAFTLTVNGTNFVSSSAVRFNGSALQTTYVSATQLTAQVPASAVTNAGTYPVVVTNPTPGGGTSNSVNFTVSAANNPVPTITTLSPNSVQAGSAAFTLTINGSNFISSSTVSFNGSALTTTYVSATQLTVQVPASAVTTAGTYPVVVTNPTPGGGTSNSVNFTVSAANNPVPTLTGISPSSAVAGSGAFTLTVSGSNFITGSVVSFGGQTLSTTFVSASQLTAQVPASDIANAESVSVTVTNPTPGGGASNAETFTVTAPSVPGASLSPTSVSFNSVTVGNTSSAQTIMLSNPGTATLNISGITIIGNGASSFAQSNNCGATLAAGAACAISVTFTPSAAGSFSASVSIADNASGSPQTASLSGTGTAPATPDFTITATPATQTIAQGGTAQYTVNVSAINGTFPGDVSLSVTGLPAGATATFSPASVTPAGAMASSTLTVQTSATAPLTGGSTHPWTFVFTAPPLLFAMLTMRRLRKRGLTLALLLLFSIATIGAITGCGGGFGSGGTTQNYTLVVTGSSGAVQHSANVQLNVQP